MIYFTMYKLSLSSILTFFYICILDKQCPNYTRSSVIARNYDAGQNTPAPPSPPGCNNNSFNFVPIKYWGCWQPLASALRAVAPLAHPLLWYCDDIYHVTCIYHVCLIKFINIHLGKKITGFFHEITNKVQKALHEQTEATTSVKTRP